MDKRLLWLWLWFIIGESLYMLKRAYFFVTGPNPMANTYGEFFSNSRVWPVLLIRGVLGAGVYWLSFYPAVLGEVLGSFGWHPSIPSLPQYAALALFEGFFVDAAIDLATTKVPYFKDSLPQIDATVVTVKQTETKTETTHETTHETSVSVAVPPTDGK